MKIDKTKIKNLLFQSIFLMLSFTSISCTATNVLEEQQGQQQNIETPAIRVNVTSAGQSELHNTIATSLYLNQVLIAKDALTATDTLFIEPRILLGNDLSRPTIISLVKLNNHCIVINNKTQQRYKLQHTQCIAFKK